MATLQLKMTYKYGTNQDKTTQIFAIPADEALDSGIKSFANAIGSLINNYTKVSNSKIVTSDLDAD